MTKCYICGTELTYKERQFKNGKSEYLYNSLYDGSVARYCMLCYKSVQDGLKTYKIRQKLQKK